MIIKQPEIYEKCQNPDHWEDKIIWGWCKGCSSCSFCKDTGKILVSSDGISDDLEEEFCSCLKGREILNKLANQ